LYSRLFNVPRNSGSLWSTYEVQYGDLKGFKFGGGVTLRDGQTACCDTPSATIPGYATFDLLAAYSLNVGKSKINAQLNVNNLLDKHYFTGLQTSGGLIGFQQGNVDFGQPRTFMGSINIQY
jgi:iron complex outermembrane recepter protein